MRAMTASPLAPASIHCFRISRFFAGSSPPTGIFGCNVPSSIRIMRLWAALPATTTGPWLPPFVRPAKSSMTRPPILVCALWQARQLSRRMGKTSEAKVGASAPRSAGAEPSKIARTARARRKGSVVCSRATEPHPGGCGPPEHAPAACEPASFVQTASASPAYAPGAGRPAGFRPRLCRLIPKLSRRFTLVIE